MKRWLNTTKSSTLETIVTDTAIESTSLLPVMNKLDVPPSVDELRKAINSLACGKAPGNDGVPSEVIKAGMNTALLYHLHELLLQCWEEGTLPQDMRDANVITLYKNKVTAATVTTSVEYPPSVSLGRPLPVWRWAGWGRQRKGCTPRLSAIQSRKVNNWHDLFTKAAAGNVSWVEETAIYCLYRPDQGLWPNQQKGSIHSPAKGRMPVQASKYDNVFPWRHARNRPVRWLSLRPFPIKNGVKQGCVVAPTLFGIFFFSLVLVEELSDEIAVYLTPKKDAVRKRCIFSLLLTTCLLCWACLLDCRLRCTHDSSRHLHVFSVTLFFCNVVQVLQTHPTLTTDTLLSPNDYS